VTVNGLGSLRRKVQSIEGDLEDEVNEAVADQAETTADDAKRNVAQENTFFTGNLARSISARRYPLVGGTRHEVAARVPYAAYVEYGTGFHGDPTAPPKFQFSSPDEADFDSVYSNVLAWVMGKPIFYGTRSPSTAAAITHKIIDEGTHPHPFLRPAWFQNKQLLINRAGLAAKSVVRRG
jgi:HK97 gp10 family phage protein